MSTIALINDIAYTQISMKTKRAVLGQALFLTLTLVLPVITHRLGLNYLVAQPMHWMILFAGLTYGPVSGLILGALAPVVSFMITGMPFPAVLPLMICELAVYGLVAGLLKQKVTAFGSLAIALIAGKIVFVTLIAILGRLEVSVLEFARMTWVPGLAAVCLQIALLPVLSGLYINWIKDE